MATSPRISSVPARSPASREERHTLALTSLSLGTSSPWTSEAEDQARKEEARLPKLPVPWMNEELNQACWKNRHF